MEYEAFLKGKIAKATDNGFIIDPADINPILKPHQRDIVRWAVQGGQRAIFAAFGLGKSIMQLETVRLTIARSGGRGLIVCPLGVRQEFVHDARMLGLDIRFIRRDREVTEDGGLWLTNYESIRDGRLSPELFSAVSLDEASVLRSFGSKTYQTFLTLFDAVPYRFVATATPSPNRYKELIHYAGFLGVMDTGQALTRFFKRDSTKANHLTLFPHKEREFWLWLNTWAIFIQRPSDLGYDDTGYDLPPLDVRWHEVAADDETRAGRDGQAALFRGGEASLIDVARNHRDSMPERIAKMKEIIDGLRAEACIQQEVLPGAQRGTAGETTGAWEEELCGPSREVQGEVEAVERAEPGEVQGTPESVRREEHREAQGVQEGVLPGPQGARQLSNAPEQAEAGVWADGSAVRGDAIPAGRALSDLQRSNGPTGSGPRPLNGGSSRPAVSSMQCGFGDIQGQPGTSTEGVRVSDQVVIWCDLNAEQREIERTLDAAGLTYSSIYGSLSVDECERRLKQWKNHETYALIGKPVMLGSGLNLQQCHHAIFVSVNFSFNGFIQSIHRIQRFGQKHRCIIDIIYASSETAVVDALRAKWDRHKELTSKMEKIIEEYGLSRDAISAALQRSLGVNRVEASGDGWKAVNNDTVLETRSMADNSVDEIVTSIPFSNHYEYTPSYNDFGHTDNNDHFWSQMDYLTPQLLRILKPGRLYCCHVKDRILFGSVTGAGAPTVDPFHAQAIAHGMKHGFDFMGMITVVTDVVRENNQTYRLGYSENSKDGSKMGVGCPEYVLLFRKPQTDRTKGYADVPVKHPKDQYSLARWQVDAHAFWRSSGERHLSPEEIAALDPATAGRLFTEQTLREVYDYESHVQIGDKMMGRGTLPSTFMALNPGSWAPDVWHDVNRMLTLNTSQSQRAQELHVCPLQFDIVDRLIERYSMPGELVFDPFGGIMTVPYRALLKDRRGAGIELNPGYWADGVKYLQSAEREKDMPTLFDLDAS